MHAPGVGVATLLCSQDVAIGRLGIDAGQHGRGALEDLVMQAQQVTQELDDAAIRAAADQHQTNDRLA